MSPKLNVLIILLIFSFSNQALENLENKGQLSEIKIQGNNEDLDQLKSIQAETMISKTEIKAIDSLEKIIKKRKGTAEEPSLYYRLAELYMRRAKSGRFFELYRDNEKAVKFVPEKIRGQTARTSLNQAISVYEKIQISWPQFDEMDAVLFNCGFAYQQLDNIKKSEDKYLTLIKKYTGSPLIPDAHLAIGEMNYDHQNFKQALEHFTQILNYPQSRVYPYGLYKSAWTLYNLNKTSEAIEHLKSVVKYFSEENLQKAMVKMNQRQNLRQESLKDLALFFGDVYSPQEAYSFFHGICTETELGQSLVYMAQLYDSHSKFKELNIFLNEYISKKPMTTYRVPSEILLINSYESLKDRSNVVQHLNSAANLCVKDSNFLNQLKEEGQKQCQNDFLKTNLEITKKWWEIYQNNKTHKDFAELTKKAFESRFIYEDSQNIDDKSHFAYAELLFQLDDFEKASIQYLLVSKSTQEQNLKHDSAFSSIVAFEKYMDLKKLDDSISKKHLITLAENYLTLNSQGQYKSQIKFKIALTYYQLKDFETALKEFNALIADKVEGDLKNQSTDIILDIYNHKNQFLLMTELLHKNLKENISQERKKYLTTILNQTDYSILQENSKKKSKVEFAKDLENYFLSHQDSTLAKEALWQSISYFYTIGYELKAAHLSLKYANTFQKDEKSKKALTESAQTFLKYGFIEKAAEIYTKLNDEESIKMATELLVISGNYKEHLSILKNNLTKNPQNTKLVLDYYSSLNEALKQSTEKDLNPYKSELLRVEKVILQKEIEPAYSKLRLAQAENLLANKQIQEAYKLTNTLINAKVSNDLKAQAHFLRGQIFKQELDQQKVKTSLNKLELVLAIKTEKLDKVQTAFQYVLKLSTDAEFKIKSTKLIIEAYDNYITSINNIIIKDEISDTDQKAIKTQLSQIVEPIASKKTEYIQLLEKSEKEQNRLAKESLNKSLPSLITGLADWYLPKELILLDGNQFKKQTYFSKCQLKKNAEELSESNLSEAINNCIHEKNIKIAHEYIEKSYENNISKSWYIFYQAIIATEQKNYSKADWYFNLVKKYEEKNPIVLLNQYRFYSITKNEPNAINSLNEYLKISTDFKIGGL